MILSNKVKELNLEKKPENIYNCDESNFSSAPSRKRVLCAKQANAVNKLTVDNDKQNYTVQVRFSLNENFDWLITK